MTREDLIKAFEMRLDGRSYQFIAENLGVSKQCLNQKFSAVLSDHAVRCPKNIVYPNLFFEIRKQYASNRDFCRIADLNYSKFSKYLSGQAKPPIEFVLRCCDILERDATFLFERCTANATS